MKRKRFFIYKVDNSITNEAYIGHTDNVKRRMREHKKNAFLPSNLQNTKCILWNSIRKYGIECFNFDNPEILAICYSKQRACELEVELIAKYDSYNSGLNTQRGGNGGGIPGTGLKLNKEQVLEIKILINDGIILRKVAEMYNVSLGTIEQIKSGKTWSCVAFKFSDNIQYERCKPENNPMYGKHHSDEALQKMSAGRTGKVVGLDHYNASLTKREVSLIKRMLVDNEMGQDLIAELFNTPASNISCIYLNKNWSHIPWPLPKPNSMPGKVYYRDVQSITTDTRSNYLIAKEYGVSQKTISYIRKHLA
jgi:group I intron endonuclease